MIRKREALGDLCQLVKGTSAISRTKPGPYPLVTTGEERKSADNFQFDTEAVCIPLISSTGHGHASLKRIHYQEGRFALANLLAAALVRDRRTLSPKFLARYLSYTKDRFIVPLMTGAANMNISIDRLATVPVALPSFDEQEKIVALLDSVDAIRELRETADKQATTIIPAIFDSMFGRPFGNAKWPMGPLGEMGTLTTGNTPPRSNPGFFGEYIEWIKTDKIDERYCAIRPAAEGLSKTGALRGRIVPKGSVLITCIAGSLQKIGEAAVTDRDVAINQQITALLPTAENDPVFICQLIGALKKRIQSQATGVMTRMISKSSLEKIGVIQPPIAIQRKFSARVAVARDLQNKQFAARQNLDALFCSIQHRAFAEAH
jgi:type I restriction enzyme S subunit